MYELTEGGGKKIKAILLQGPPGKRCTLGFSVTMHLERVRVLAALGRGKLKARELRFVGVQAALWIPSQSLSSSVAS